MEKSSEKVARSRKEVSLWVLAIGVSQYQDPSINLRYADHDAEKIAETLASQEGVLFNRVHTLVLTNQQASRAEILKAMSQFLGQAAEADVVLIFMAGHGLLDKQTGSYYFVPHNANMDNLIYEGLSMPMFEESIKRLQSFVKKIVLWTDTCHSGAITLAARAGVSVGEDVALALEKAEGRYILSAARAGEVSLEDDDFRFEGESKGHGAFTFALLKGLRGGAADEDGVVRMSDLFKFVNRDVALSTKGKQHPWSEMFGTDMPLFVAHQVISTAPVRPEPDPDPVVVPHIPVVGPQKRGGKRWLWFLLGLGAAGGAGAAVALGGGGKAVIGDPPETGLITIDVAVPE